MLQGIWTVPRQSLICDDNDDDGDDDDEGEGDSLAMECAVWVPHLCAWGRKFTLIPNVKPAVFVGV